MKQKDRTLSNKTDRCGSSPISSWGQTGRHGHRASQLTMLFTSSLHHTQKLF